MLFKADFALFWAPQKVLWPTTWVQNALDSGQMCLFIILVGSNVNSPLHGHARHPKCPNSRIPPGPPCTVGPKIAPFKAFLEIAWANMGQKWVKIALNHLFEHPKGCRNNFGKNHFRLTSDPCNRTRARSALHHSSGALTVLTVQT